MSLSVDGGDFRVETFRSGGKGGQHQNTTDSGARIIHVATGISAESRSERSQKYNKRIAFRNLINKPEFQLWLRLETAKRTGVFKDIDKQVESMMEDKNLRVEIKRDGRWEEENVNESNCC